jgi:hypothetical protein
MSVWLTGLEDIRFDLEAASRLRSWMLDPDITTFHIFSWIHAVVRMVLTNQEINQRFTHFINASTHQHTNWTFPQSGCYERIRIQSASMWIRIYCTNSWVRSSGDRVSKRDCNSLNTENRWFKCLNHWNASLNVQQDTNAILSVMKICLSTCHYDNSGSFVLTESVIG